MAETETGRARVRRLLINPLLKAGMRKHPNMKADDYADMLVRLSDKLAYLADDRFDGLRMWVTAQAKGKGRDIWPAEVAIVAQAYFLQSPPPRKHPFVESLLQSEAGRRARAGGYHVELMQEAVRLGPPFNKYSMAVLQGRARDNRRKLVLVTGQIERDTASEDDRKWLDWYLRQEEACFAIMDARAEGVGSEGAAA